MLFYFVLVVVMLMIFLLSRYKKSNWWLFLSVSIMVFVSAVRFDVGYDYPVYYALSARTGDYVFEFIRLEPFSQLIIMVVWFFEQPQLIFVFFGAPTIVLVAKSIREQSTDPDFAILLYFLFPLFFIDSLSLIRQHLAIAVVFYSFRYVLSRKLLPFVLLILGASLFHLASIFCLLIYVIPTLNFNRWMYAGAIAASFLMGSRLIVSLVSYIPYYSSYVVEGVVRGEGGSMIKLVINALGILFICIHNRLLVFDEKNKLYLISFYVGVVLLNLLSVFGHAGLRSFEFFGVGFLILFPQLLRLFTQRRVASTLLIVGLSLFFGVYIGISAQGAKKSPLTPYQMFWTQDRIEFK